MTKRLLALILAVMTAVMLMLGSIASVSAEAYPNTHTNTGDQRHDIVQIALTQLGYTESETDMSGRNGRTKYGEFYGYPYADWCGCFVNWCARKAGVSTSVLKKTGLTQPSNWGLTGFRSSERTPQPGDLFFKCNTSGSYAGHVGIVYKVDVSKNICYTIEGNTGSRASDGQAYIVKIVERTLSQHVYGSPNYAGSSNNSNHTHNYSTHYEDSHPHKIYKKCDTCGYTTYTGDKKTLDNCTECKQANCSHSYDSWVSSGDSQHKHTCSKCGKVETGSHSWNDVKTIKEANCKETGSKLQSCSACGAERTKNIDKTGEHTYGSWEYVSEESHQRTCNFCGTADVKKHELGEDPQWSADVGYHWHECSVCNQKISNAQHQYGEDCVSPCETCQYVREDGHIFSQELSTDGAEHWFDCINCDARSNVEQHIYSAECDEDCDSCGYVRDVIHTFEMASVTSSSVATATKPEVSASVATTEPAVEECNDAMMSDATGHWLECATCGKKESFAAHTPGAEATEESAQNCTECGYEIAPKLDHVHKYEPFQTNTLSHWGKCRCGYELQPETHVWDMATGCCATCGMASIMQTNSFNYDLVWLGAGAALVLILILTICVMAASHKKRKQLEADPYMA